MITLFRYASRKARESSELLNLFLTEIRKTPLLSQGEEVRLIKLIRKGDQDAYHRMISANLRFVVSVAKQYQNRGLPLIDLINEGSIGLMKAVRLFDESKGFKLITYAVWWIHQTILQALAKQSRIISLPVYMINRLAQIDKTHDSLELELKREPTAEEIAQETYLSETAVSEALRMSYSIVSLDSSPFDNQERDLCELLESSGQLPDRGFIDSMLKQEIIKVLKSLEPREADVVSLYFGLDGQPPLTLEEIGALFNLTRERIRQIKEKAIKRLRLKSRSAALQPFLADL